MKNIILFSFLIVSSIKMYGQKPEIVVGDKEGWHKIGETTVNFKTETDEIVVIGADRFSSIKIRVDKEPIDLISFDIYFETGEKQNVTIGKEFKAPGETHVVKLTGGDQRIKKIVFTYKTDTNAQNKKAHVELWGLKTGSEKKKSTK